MIKINDIKPIVIIPDFSIYLYYSLYALSFLFLCLVLYLLYRFFQPKVITKEHKWYEKLQNLDFKNTKKSAYDISKYGRLLAKDERQIRLIEELSEELSSYKYQKKISKEFTSNIKTKFNVFMDTLDVR